MTQAVSTQFYISYNGYAFKKEGSTDKWCVLMAEKSENTDKQK